ncbi:hypothetical protein VPH35_116299 [Triticum aestivum]|uniref:Uncharacterized protein n=1 Tax=Aegilops tauschii subsp. strangulata TaxID=200361 RepID=A0A453NH19_AEGTS
MTNIRSTNLLQSHTLMSINNILNPVLSSSNYYIKTLGNRFRAMHSRFSKMISHETTVTKDKIIGKYFKIIFYYPGFRNEVLYSFIIFFKLKVHEAMWIHNKHAL